MKRVLQIYRDGEAHTRSLNIPLADGEQGNMQTLEAMAAIVREQRGKPDLRAFVLREIIGGVSGHNPATQVRRIFEYARDRIRYQRDPFGVERIADIWSILYALDPGTGPEGDCGVKSLFIAACCAAIGIKPFFVVIKQRPGQETFNHVYNAVLIDGQIRYYDATPEDKPAGWEAPSVEKWLVPIF